MNYLTGEFFIKSSPTANGENTENIVEWLRKKQPETRSILIWDNGTYHRKGVFRDYLGEKNKELREEDWAVTCLNFTPYAPRGVAPPPRKSRGRYLVTTTGCCSTPKIG